MMRRHSPTWTMSEKQRPIGPVRTRRQMGRGALEGPLWGVRGGQQTPDARDFSHSGCLSEIDGVVSNIMTGTVAPRSTTQQVLRRIRSKGRGAVFVPSDFLDLGSRGAVDMALSRLVRGGHARRLSRGVYDYPRQHDRLGALPPALPKVAQAIARSGGLVLQPSGAFAANALGLSTQVPAQLVYFTNGSSRRIKVGNQTIRFKQATPKGLLGAGSVAGVVIQAIRHLGRDGLTDHVIAHLSKILKDQDKRALVQLVPSAPAWMHPYLNRICDQPASQAA